MKIDEDYIDWLRLDNMSVEEKPINAIVLSSGTAVTKNGKTIPYLLVRNTVTQCEYRVSLFAKKQKCLSAWGDDSELWKGKKVSLHFDGHKGVIEPAQ